MFGRLLFEYNKRVRKPLIRVKPNFFKEICNNLNEIQKDWNNYISGENEIKPIDKISKDQKRLNSDNKWDALILYAYGNKNKDALAHFKSLESYIVENSEEIQMVMFSILKPGMHIPPHRGNLSSVLRCQLIIENPEAAKTGLRVANEKFILHSGDSIIFDDTFEHEAWNNSTKNRVALIIDYKKPFPILFNCINTRNLKKFSKSDYVTSVIKKW